MKPTDLMIDDWVHVDKTPIKINQVCKECIICDFGDGDEEVDCFEPIPLTPEILEKNGFEYIDDEYASWYLNGHFELRVREPYCGKEEFEYCNIILNYVHELQHLMRLCKINKEIVL